MAIAIGIDLGTCFSEVACLENGRPKVIPNAEGQSCTPSVVAFAQAGQLLVGQAARRQATANPLRTVSSIKRRMGSWHTVAIDERRYTPQEISGFILRKLKADAEDHLGERIEQAVITVPAYFNDRQRQATREAGILAGLSVLGLLNEPTATAIAYGLNREDAHTILVWDLGAGTFDVSLLALGEGIFEVRAVSGDNQLGGDDFTRRVADHMALHYQRTYDTPLPDRPDVWERLGEEAENAKIRLCYSPVVRVSLPFLVSGPQGPRHLETELTRGQFNALTADLVERLVIPTRQALKDADLSPQQIDRVILAGGGCLMPAVRELARKLFGKEPYRHIDPFTVVAQGAAIYAGMLLGLVDRAVLLDVLPLSLGVETQGGLMARVIARNTPLPASAGQVFATATDYQTTMDIHILQGERELAVDNISLGQFQLDGIPSARRGVAKVEVSFGADVDGIVHVSAKDLLAENEVKVRVASTKLLDPGEIERLKEEAQRNEEQDKERRARVLAGIEADNTIAAAEMALEEMGSPGSDPSVGQIVRGVGEVKTALASGMVEEIRLQCRELRRLLAALHQDGRIPSESMARG
ncbi:MAG: Molecular chaperone DnaK [Dehalococcoidia bacterium]|nr:Molecular chaperone DnaK [Dehalococcoidia bacterium]